jgi:hypothetical protein
MDLFGGLASLLGGGVSGIIGAAIQKYADYKTKQQEYAHTLALRQLDIQIMDREWEGRARIASIEGEAAIETAASALQQESYNNDRATYSDLKSSQWMLLVDVTRGMVRPFATIYFVVFATWVFFEVSKLITLNMLTVDQLYEIFYYCIIWVLYTAGMVLGWWFGVRSPAGTLRLPKLGGK